MLAGASALLGADIIARLALSAAELPIGVVTATLGAPVFIWLLLAFAGAGIARRRRQGRRRFRLTSL
ncbi:Vitamin B12 ABC transporter [Klebsiella pneumoniae]|uniref:Vitamin B12 ABC transporter n=1 Tax=Klebsiella pneumoniae TaxID=573 RepID=A0A377WJW8_KLEPN|nr:Vitamin B12 ABC transporter [Klebsiella pneumoniae]